MSARATAVGQAGDLMRSASITERVLWKKERRPGGRLSYALFCDYEPRQEPGRYLDGTVVPSAGRPQRQPLIAIGPPVRAVETAAAPLFSGRRVTLPTGRPPVVYTVMWPLASVMIVPTYFDTGPVVFSQPHELAPGGVPPV